MKFGILNALVFCFLFCFFVQKYLLLLWIHVDGGFRVLIVKYKDKGVGIDKL